MVSIIAIILLLSEDFFFYRDGNKTRLPEPVASETNPALSPARHQRDICRSARSDVRARRLGLEVVRARWWARQGRCERAAAASRSQDEPAAPQDDEFLVPVADRAADRLLPGDVQEAQRRRHGARPEPAGGAGGPAVPPLLLRPRAARERAAAQDAVAAVQPQGQVPHPGAPLPLGVERALGVRRRAQEQVRRERRLLRHRLWQRLHGGRDSLAAALPAHVGVRRQHSR